MNPKGDLESLVLMGGLVCVAALLVTPFLGFSVWIPVMLGLAGATHWFAKR